MDAIDAALVSIVGHKLKLICYQQIPMSKELQQTIRSINTQSTLSEVSKIDVVLGNLFAGAALQVLKAGGLSPTEIHAIGSHGQTILHLPNDKHPRTLQIGDANIIAYQTGITTVADFRRMDIAAGGEGAPLTPAFHQWLFQDKKNKRVILNIGGIANITILPSDDKTAISGFDTGPGNMLMDEWIQQHLGHNFDKDGNWAKSGQCNQTLLSILLDDVYFKTAPPKSTGKNFFNLQWLEKKLSLLKTIIEPNNIQATLLELSVITMNDAIKKHAPDCDEILICGGGVHNKSMMRRLRSIETKIKIHSTEKIGLDPDAVEAVAFAWLAKRRMENQSENVISVTGADDHVILGAIYNSQVKSLDRKR